MRRAPYSTALLTALFLLGCGGNDNPTAPTMVPTATTPIVVTVTAQVVNNTTQALRTLTPQETVESRNVRISGNATVTGGSATVGGRVSYTFRPDGSQPPVTVEQDAFPPRTIGPDAGFSFFVDIPLLLPPGTSTNGDVVVKVTGTDERGAGVNVATPSIPVDNALTKKPAFTCVPDATTLCMDGGAGSQGRFRARVNWRDFDNNTGSGLVREIQRFNDGGAFYFFTPENYDLFVQVLDRCNTANRFWVFAAGTTDVEYTLTVTDTVTNQSRAYENFLGTPAEAITDTAAFATCP